MPLLNKQEIVDALTRLGELAVAQQVRLELTVFGGAVMVMVFGTRQATKDVDIADARRLLQELPPDYNRTWSMVAHYLQPGSELKAKYAFDDLWEEIHGKPD